MPDLFLRVRHSVRHSENVAQQGRFAAQDSDALRKTERR